jgi:kinesin family protein 2/24
MEAEREERRRAMQERKQTRKDEETRIRLNGNTGDVDFVGLVQAFRDAHAAEAQNHEEYVDNKICICVRKRPMSEKERQKKDHDSITCYHPHVWVHNAKLKVDGITKYLDHSSFKFDHAFDETLTNEQVYLHSTMPLIDFICAGTGGRATVFAYGQTGSGKTHTMEGIHSLVAQDLFETLASGDLKCKTDDTIVLVAFFEIYSGFVQDLLNDRNKLKVLEDAKGEIVVNGLEEFEATDPSQFLNLVAKGNE